MLSSTSPRESTVLISSFLLRHLAHQVSLLFMPVSVGIILYGWGRGTHVNILWDFLEPSEGPCEDIDVLCCDWDVLYIDGKSDGCDGTSE